MSDQKEPKGCFNCAIANGNRFKGKLANCLNHGGKSKDSTLCFNCILEADGEMMGAWSNCKAHKEKLSEYERQLNERPINATNQYFTQARERKQSLRSHKSSASNVKKQLIAKYNKELSSTNNDRPEPVNTGGWLSGSNSQFVSLSPNQNDGGSKSMKHADLKSKTKENFKLTDNIANLLEVNCTDSFNSNNNPLLQNQENAVRKGAIRNLISEDEGTGNENDLNPRPPMDTEVCAVSIRQLEDLQDDEVFQEWRSHIIGLFSSYGAVHKIPEDVVKEIASHVACMVKLSANVYVRGSGAAVSLIKGHNDQIRADRARTGELQREILNKLEAYARPCVNQDVLLNEIRKILGVNTSGNDNVKIQINEKPLEALAERLLTKVEARQKLSKPSEVIKITQRSDKRYELPYGKSHRIYNADQLNAMQKMFEETQDLGTLNNSRGGYSNRDNYGGRGGRSGRGGRAGGSSYRGRGIKRAYEGPSGERHSNAEEYVRSRLTKYPNYGPEQGHVRTNGDVIEAGDRPTASNSDKCRAGFAKEKRDNFIASVLRPKARFIYDGELDEYRAPTALDIIGDEDTECYIMEKNDYLTVKTKKDQLTREFNDKPFTMED